MKIMIKQFAAAAVAATILTGCCQTRRAVASWEYKVVSRDAYAEATEKHLNELAGQGWTVVSVSTTSRGEHTIPSAMIVLKRPKQP
jgi:hypothetical protein